jgi:hypothetical protein
VLEANTLKVKMVTEDDLGIYACYLGDKILKEYDVDVSFR